MLTKKDTFKSIYNYHSIDQSIFVWGTEPRIRFFFAKTGSSALGYNKWFIANFFVLPESAAGVVNVLTIQRELGGLRSDHVRILDQGLDREKYWLMKEFLQPNLFKSVDALHSDNTVRNFKQD